MLSHRRGITLLVDAWHGMAATTSYELDATHAIAGLFPRARSLLLLLLLLLTNERASGLLWRSELGLALLCCFC